MTLADLQTLTLSWLDDLQAGYFTLPQVNVFLNNAQKEVQKRLIKAGQNYYVIRCQTNLVISQQDYVLPDDFRKLHRLELVISGTNPNETIQPLQPITINEQDLVLAQPATPNAYFIKRNRLSLYPIPDAALIMRMYYSYLVTDMTLVTDIPDVPPAYQELIALLAAQDGFLKDGRSNELLQSKIAAYERDFDADAQERNQDRPRRIVETGNDDYGGYLW